MGTSPTPDDREMDRQKLEDLQLDDDEQENNERNDDEYNALDQRLDEINFCLDLLEQQNDNLRSQLMELLESSRIARKEFAKNHDTHEEGDTRDISSNSL